MIVAGYNTSWQDSIDALAKDEEVKVLVYDSKQPTVRMYNFSQDEAEEMQGIIDEWLEEFYAD